MPRDTASTPEQTDTSSTTEERALITLDQLAPSPFNKREISADDPTIKSLAESLKQRQLQDILVRPLLADTVQRVGDYEEGRRFQIAAGHRRFAAAVFAGLPALRAVVRVLSDEDMREIHAIENMQRENLNALEEARTFELMTERDGMSYQQIADKIGRSKSFVAGRLKLLQIVPQVLAALEAGKIDAEVAVLLSRVHPKLQASALNRALERGPDGGQHSYRRIRDDLIERYSLKLSEAIFDIKDGSLIPNAPACTACPKRSGGDPDLFGDLVKRDGYGKKGENLCTDEVCWDEKKKAHLKIEADKLAAKGTRLVTGGAARTAISAQGEVKGAYVALADVKDQLAKVKAKTPDKVPEVVTIQDPRTGKTVKAVKREDVKAAGVKLESAERAGPQRSYEAEERKRVEQRKKNAEGAKAENAFRVQLLQKVRAVYAGQARSIEDLQMVSRYMLEHMQWRSRELLCTLRGWRSVEQGVKAMAAEADASAHAVLMLDIAVCLNVMQDESGYGTLQSKLPEPLVSVSKRYGIKVDKLRAEWAAQRASERTREIHSGDRVRLVDGSEFEVLRLETDEAGVVSLVVWADKAERSIAAAEVAEVLPKPKGKGAASAGGAAADQTATAKAKTKAAKNKAMATPFNKGAGGGE